MQAQESKVGRIGAGALPPPARQPVAAGVLGFAEKLTVRAQMLADQVDMRLRPVMTSDNRAECLNSAEKPEEYPPLFADLRNCFQGIEGALDRIEDALSRTEL